MDNLFAGHYQDIFMNRGQAWESSVFCRGCRISDIYKDIDIIALLTTTKKFWSFKSRVFGLRSVKRNL